MPRAIWKGTISFGLVTIPVGVFAAVAPKELSFKLLDSADLSPVHNKRVNSSGEEVPWDRIVKGYQLADGRWVTVTDDDFRSANVRATQTIDVMGAVKADDIPREYFDAPYYLVPEKPGEKAYALLREALVRADRVAVAQIVIRTRQRLAAIVPDGEHLVLEVLRWPYELRDATELEVPGSDLAALGVTDAEMALAEQLVATIESAWEPQRYRDTYHDDLLALIARKAEGEAVEIAEEPVQAPATVIDIATLLKRSVEDARRDRAASGS